MKKDIKLLERITGVVTRGLFESGEDPDPAVTSLVNQYALKELAPDAFAAFRLDLCNDQVDKHFSRFPVSELENIARLTPGRPLMVMHDLYGSLPKGTFFRAEVVKKGKVSSVRADVYLLRTDENEEFIAQIEGGVYREISIGFRCMTRTCSICGLDILACEHMPGKKYGKQVCHYVMEGVGEVIEGSVVAAGSQGVGFVEQVRHEPEAGAEATGEGEAAAEAEEEGSAAGGGGEAWRVEGEARDRMIRVHGHREKGFRLQASDFR